MGDGMGNGRNCNGNIRMGSNVWTLNEKVVVRTLDGNFGEKVGVENEVEIGSGKIERNMVGNWNAKFAVKNASGNFGVESRWGTNCNYTGEVRTEKLG